ncbi:MAG: glycosyltransferase family 2 protein [Muribaculaceae bacterium]|nr:glycosyltransferase family 2 protein [Muribaculaceae bacterium]
MEKISATILAFNEGKRIGACLESLSGIADEVVVVDSFSTDNTVEICHAYGCKVVRREFDGFGAQRQYATSLTSNKYILSIDADEVVSPALRDSLLRLKEEGFTHRVYSVARLNFYCGYPVRHCGWYPDRQIRLFDKRYANWNLKDVGEKVIFRDSVLPEPLDGDILHYRCDTREQYQNVTRNHASIKARVLAARPRPIHPLSPVIHGLKAFWHTYISEGGIFEGNAGREISAESYRAEYLAYRAARQLKNS